MHSDREQEDNEPRSSMGLFAPGEFGHSHQSATVEHTAALFVNARDQFYEFRQVVNETQSARRTLTNRPQHDQPPMLGDDTLPDDIARDRTWQEGPGTHWHEFVHVVNGVKLEPTVFPASSGVDDDGL